ncbi:hypothetical protein BDN70DRAFT_797187 [Pholiota conissans]|uniref:CRA domain-containing protein n=1 Tax=Pholiota conissans TaxID=109636 RepID=A0A9P5ZC71_9AGAR|nr:hypothetical protein BDN70DRAFT_797187 [Pholiota conissans]
MFDSLTVSDLLGYTSIGCWLGAQFPQVIENIKLQSCEGLALPFLANWLMGDISNLVGCILTHQLPFQTYLATYFVCVDFMLVAQYYYYYKPSKGPPSTLGHIRAATSPAGIRRLSIERGVSRYRALSAVASNVAVAAALAAQQDEAEERRISRYSKRYDPQHATDSSGDASRVMDGEDEECEDNIPSSMIDSFRSDRADQSSKRVSWSIERSRGRAGSVGRPISSPNPAALQHLSEELIPLPQSGSFHRHETTTNADLNEPVVSSRGTRASRKGSTMVFLGAWTLFGIGTLASQRASPFGTTSTDVGRDIGRVLASVQANDLVPIAQGLSPRDMSSTEPLTFNLELASVKSSTDINAAEEPHVDPTSEQVLGRIFAWLCTTLYLTSRLPQIWKNYVRKSVEGLSMYLFVFAFLGNTFYVSSILLSPKRFLPPSQSTQFIRESIPYLLGSGGTLVFDVTIVAQSFCYKRRHRRHHSVAHTRPLDEEEAALLSGDPLLAHPDSAITNRGRTSQINLYCGVSLSMDFDTRSLVLDYLCHNCYTRTASAFNRESTVRQLDADGDEIIDDVSGTQGGARNIRTHIMSGRVDDAITLLSAHFPAVLSEDIAIGAAETSERHPASTRNVEYISSTSTEPAHLYLNLRILAFSEACRTVPLDYPPKSGAPQEPEPSEVMNKSTAEENAGIPESAEHFEQQMALLTRAQKLYALSNTLPNPADRATYLKELENVGGLLAYTVPEKSSMAKYLTLERREAVADQINRAILKSTGRPLVSFIELMTRHTHLVWQFANELGIETRPGAVLPPRGRNNRGDDDNDVSKAFMDQIVYQTDIFLKVAPIFDLHQFLNVKH